MNCIYKDQVYCHIAAAALFLFVSGQHLTNVRTFPRFVPYTIPFPGAGWNCATLTCKQQRQKSEHIAAKEGRAKPWDLVLLVRHDALGAEGRVLQAQQLAGGVPVTHSTQIES